MEPDDNANRLQMTLVPAGAGGRVFVADLKVYARDFSYGALDPGPREWGVEEPDFKD